MDTGSRTMRHRRPPAARLPGIATLVVGVALLISLTALSVPGPAVAAAATRPDAAYYVSAVTAIEPAVPGLEVVVHGGGESITLTNRTGKPVTVLGYSGEDYLRITAGGAQVNTSSPTAALNAADGRSAPVPTATKKQPAAKWRPVGATNSFTWNDFRPQWSAEQRPPIVTADPHASHQVFAWGIQLTVGSTPVLVRGTVTWTGTPLLGRAALLLAVGGVLLLALAIAVIIWIALRRRRLRRREPHDIPLAPVVPRADHPTGAR
jgi:hypothetical protein